MTMDTLTAMWTWLAFLPTECGVSPCGIPVIVYRERIRNLLLLPTALVGIIGFQSDISWVILTIFSLWAIELTTEWFRQKYVRGNFLSRDVSKDSESVGKDDKQNVVISGDYSPFVGSWYDIHGW